MNRVEIDCATGEEKIVRLTAKEETRRLAEIAQATVEQKAQDIADAKSALIMATAELQAAQALGAAGDLTTEDVTKKQASVTAAKQVLKGLEAPMEP